VLVAFGGLGALLGPVIGAGVFAILDEALTTSLQLREVFYGLFVIAIFLGFRRGVVQTLVVLVRRLGRSRAPATELDAAPDPR
jgi:ABC-type branched-subunit amino acid transport system permease subunit